MHGCVVLRSFKYQISQKAIAWLDAGGSAGIGKATAFAFDANGCSVAVLGRRIERLDAVVSQSPYLALEKAAPQPLCTLDDFTL